MVWELRSISAGPVLTCAMYLSRCKSAPPQTARAESTIIVALTLVPVEDYLTAIDRLWLTVGVALPEAARRKPALMTRKNPSHDHSLPGYTSDRAVIGPGHQGFLTPVQLEWVALHQSKWR